MEWIGWQEAVVLHARDLVSWSYGESVKDVFGGYSKNWETISYLAEQRAGKPRESG